MNNGECISKNNNEPNESDIKKIGKISQKRQDFIISWTKKLVI